MSDLRTQRNLAFGVAAVAAVALALVLGFLLGRGGRETGETAVADLPGAAVVAPMPIGGGEPAEPAVEVPAAPAPAVREVPAPAAARPPAPRPAPRPEVDPVESPGDPQPATPSEVEPPARDPDPEPTPRPHEPVRLTVPEGTQINLALTEPVSSQTAKVGNAVTAELTEAVEVDGRVALPAGTRLAGRVTEAVALHRIGGQAKLAFSFESLRVDGAEVPIAAHFAREGKSETGKDAATIAAGAAIGIILGNQAKRNDRGRVIGGVVGAAAGTAAAAATEGETIELPAGTELRLTLRGDVTVTR